MAIDSRELRIGNWVAVGNNQSIVAEIMYGKIHLMGNAVLNRPDQIEPIPLTPDVLFENLGFVGKYKSCGYVFSKNGVTLTSQDEDDQGNPIENYVFHVHLNHAYEGIYYLHQLQNLFYSLTNTELVYKP